MNLKKLEKLARVERDNRREKDSLEMTKRLTLVDIQTALSIAEGEGETCVEDCPSSPKDKVTDPIWRHKLHCQTEAEKAYLEGKIGYTQINSRGQAVKHDDPEARCKGLIAIDTQINRINKAEFVPVEIEILPQIFIM